MLSFIQLLFFFDRDTGDTDSYIRHLGVAANTILADPRPLSPLSLEVPFWITGYILWLRQQKIVHLFYLFNVFLTFLEI